MFRLSIIKYYRIWWKIWSKDDTYNFKFIIYSSFEKNLEEQEVEVKNV